MVQLSGHGETLKEDGRIVNDSSKLLVVPSPASTSNPSLSNLNEYGAADGAMPRNSSSASFEMLLAKQEHEGFFTRVLSSVRYLFCERPSTRRALFFAAICLATLLMSAWIHHPLAVSVSPEQPKPRAGPKLHFEERPPFSSLDPVADLGMSQLERPEVSMPPDSVLRDPSYRALPTNAWYQNMLMVKEDEPSNVHRVYAVPYVLDAVGPIPGLRAHPNHVDASTTVVQLSFVDSHGITLGAAPNALETAEPLTKKYSVISSTSLAVTLQWDALPMSSTIVKGMPYATVHYPKPLLSQKVLPSIASEVSLASEPIADGNVVIGCDNKAVRVENELKMSFKESDFTWLVFFSEPVIVQCIEHPTGLGAAAVVFQVVDLGVTFQEETAEQLTIRAALLTNCTSGQNSIYCAHRQSPTQTERFAKLLREHAVAYPGPRADVRYDIKYDNDEALLKLDWDVRNMKVTASKNDTKGSTKDQLRGEPSREGNLTSTEIITYALPHHLNRMPMDSKTWSGEQFCTSTMIGTSCVVSGASWDLVEDMPPISFFAPRPPRPEALVAISGALTSDLSFKLADYYERGAGDTYFSGKMLAKLARVLLVAEELRGLCSPHNKRDFGYVLTKSEKSSFGAACRHVSLPPESEMKTALTRLRRSVEVWINGTAETPFIYDSGWGGVISCGCQFDGETNSCANRFPNCPALHDPGLDFGNGFYNDHHFHFGYIIYAAAAVAHFDPSWGQRHFENVLLLVRDIANPSNDDLYFPLTRHKDWYQGNSWASGVPLPPYLNGRNQESSSEAIAAYEAVALFGQEMMHASKDEKDKLMYEVASHVRDVGRVLTATEVHAADYYWHVRQHNESMRIYPATYNQNAVGMLWSSAMATFQTWFGNAPFLAIGIQLLPLTAIAESRDDPEWLREMYPGFAESCGAVDTCMKQGWSILELATLASVGHVSLALEKTQQLPDEVFDSAGGNGHSLTNTLWYVATRPEVRPIDLSGETPQGEGTEEEKAKPIDCGIPETCTVSVLNADAKGATCLARITWLMSANGYSEARACHKVGGEFPSTCGQCDPGSDAVREYKTMEEESSCPPCSKEVCLSDLNRCPRFEVTFVCTAGLPGLVGGCSPTPWDLGTGQCESCCEVTVCRDYENFETDEPPEAENASPTCVKCDKEICHSRDNQCQIHAAPYLCVEGRNKRGCSPWPWRTDDGQCEKCCDLSLSCE